MGANFQHSTFVIVRGNQLLISQGNSNGPLIVLLWCAIATLQTESSPKCIVCCIRILSATFPLIFQVIGSTGSEMGKFVVTG